MLDEFPALGRLDFFEQAMAFMAGYRITAFLIAQAEDDMGAPPAATRRRLIDLSGKGRPITLLEYPDTDHGIVRFETAPVGSRTSLGYAPGYFEAVLDWARTGRLDGTYGDGRIFARAGAAAAASGSVR